ncbi:ISL3 family transposase [bacterium]|nr:MAG: ISL3 family transposase [bacterium]
MPDDCITVALDLPEVRVIRQEEKAEGITVELEYRRRRAVCPGCGQETPKVHSVQLQHKRDRRLWDKPVFLVLRKRRFRCLACGKVFTEHDPVCGPRRRSSQRFRRYLGQEAIDQPVRHVARKEGVGEGLVRRCVTEEAKRLLQAPEETPPARVLGLDEFSIKKGQVYDTAVVDLEHKRVIGVVSGHRQAELVAFLESLPKQEQLKVVVMDMHEPFRQAVELCLPQARVVADKFHVLLHVHKALDQVRTSLQPERGRKGELFQARYLLLTAVERLKPERYARLMDLLPRYPALQRAWALKEAFRAWYHSATRAEAEASLALWENTVREQGPEPFKALFPMLNRWRQEILNYFDYPYTNGFLEGKNNRIKVIKRVAYGYRNPVNFRQRILLTNGKEARPKATRGLSHLLT